LADSLAYSARDAEVWTLGLSIPDRAIQEESRFYVGFMSTSAIYVSNFRNFVSGSAGIGKFKAAALRSTAAGESAYLALGD
jgi:hypothetical protein